MAHGWLIVGPANVGKQTLAYQIICLVLSGAKNFQDLKRLSREAPLFQRIANSPWRPLGC